MQRLEVEIEEYEAEEDEGSVIEGTILEPDDILGVLEEIEEEEIEGGIADIPDGSHGYDLLSDLDNGTENIKKIVNT